MFGVWRTRDGDSLHGGGAFQYERLYVRVTPWRVILVGAALGAYALGLAAFLPAEAAIGRDRDAVGTVWSGETALPPGFAVGWTIRPLRSLVGLGPAGDVRVRGPETLIEGRASWRDGPVLDQARGVGSLRLINAAVPALPFACDGEMTVTADGLAMQGGRDGKGSLRSGPAQCAGGGVTTTSSPLDGALTSDAEGASMRLNAAGAGELARARVARDGALSLTVTPAGAAVLPGMAATTVEVR